MKFMVDLSSMLVQPLPSPSKKVSVRHRDSHLRPCVQQRLIDKHQRGPLYQNENNDNSPQGGPVGCEGALTLINSEWRIHTLMRSQGKREPAKVLGPQQLLAQCVLEDLAHHDGGGKDLLDLSSKLMAVKP